MRRTVSASIGAVYAAWMMFSITCSACAAWDSDLLERDMIAMRLPLTIMVKSGNARSTSRRTSSTGPSHGHRVKLLRNRDGTCSSGHKTSSDVDIWGKGRLFVKLFAGQHVSMHVEYRLASINSGVEDQAEGTVEFGRLYFAADRAMWARLLGIGRRKLGHVRIMLARHTSTCTLAFGLMSLNA